jgi:hypothetical protein
VVSVNAIWPKVGGFDTFKGDKIGSTYFFGWEIQPSAPCRRTLWHVKDPYEYERNTSYAKFSDHFFVMISCFANRGLYWSKTVTDLCWTNQEWLEIISKIWSWAPGRGPIPRRTDFDNFDFWLNRCNELHWSDHGSRQKIALPPPHSYKTTPHKAAYKTWVVSTSLLQAVTLYRTWTKVERHARPADLHVNSTW